MWQIMWLPVGLQCSCQRMMKHLSVLECPRPRVETRKARLYEPSLALGQAMARPHPASAIITAYINLKRRFFVHFAHLTAQTATALISMDPGEVVPAESP